MLEKEESSRWMMMDDRWSCSRGRWRFWVTIPSPRLKSARDVLGCTAAASRLAVVARRAEMSCGCVMIEQGV